MCARGAENGSAFARRLVRIGEGELRTAAAHESLGLLLGDTPGRACRGSPLK